MSILFATLGFTPGAVNPVIAWAKGIKKVVVFHSKNKRSIQAKDEIERVCEDVGVDFEPYQVKDEYSLVSLVKEIKDVMDRYKSINEYKDEEIIFNITGGTKMISSAGLLVCVLKGIKAVYVRETDNQVLEVPLPRLKYTELLSDTEKELLSLISKKCKDDYKCELCEIYEEKLGKKRKKAAPSVIAYYLGKLEEKGLIERVAMDKKRKLVKLKESATLLIDID